jgi:hypothetical protein
VRSHVPIPATMRVHPWCSIKRASHLEHVVGLSKESAAADAAVFGLAMLVGRTALLRLIAAERLFPLALVVTLLGFIIYRPRGGVTLSAHARFRNGSRGHARRHRKRARCSGWQLGPPSHSGFAG